MNKSERTEIQTQIEHDWQRLLYTLKRRFKKKPDLQEMIFLIGVQELGTFQMEFSKEEKEDLMHIAVCTLLEPVGYYKFLHKDEDGWPHFEALTEIPTIKLHEQEYLLKQQILRYFEET